MVSAKSVDDQLRKIRYNRGWNRPECDELTKILLIDEEIFECVNGWYEGGFAMLCATNIRVLLIDKKPLKFLTVEDLRFDTINQIDFYHRMFNASICITAGLKNLTFRSYDQERLRKLIGHVQHRMAEIKSLEQAERVKNENNMKEMDQQLRSYLLSQYEQSQSLRNQYQAVQPQPLPSAKTMVAEPQPTLPTAAIDVSALTSGVSSSELYQEGIKEIFGKRYKTAASSQPVMTVSDPIQLSLNNAHRDDNDQTLLEIAYAKLPMILRRRKQAKLNEPNIA